ncbi:hypothetical protein N836_13770 [Leptolyngbya sp. Heron Island J]|uniref:hypothetical protein n=1 Tax=Leptolyngbya sp. Heron Island J TaxID=1385935 RepID=UPI0003B95ACA|nr:hypothetical protein [Leptolyngbya sp. Heron Island J]ESA35039.1 hypothetical protein N836_13770 [Leptolyngbya sp. Heron Island J]
MSAPLDFDRYPHGCEIVIPIVLKIPIYIEPIVIERTAICHRDPQSEVASLKSQLSETEPVMLAKDVQTVANLNMNVLHDFSFAHSWQLFVQSVVAVLRSFMHAIQDLFEEGMSGRERFLQQ